MIGALLNHLWQSTLFAGTAGLVVRRGSQRVGTSCSHVASPAARRVGGRSDDRREHTPALSKTSLDEALSLSVCAGRIGPV